MNSAPMLTSFALAGILALPAETQERQASRVGPDSGRRAVAGQEAASASRSVSLPVAAQELGVVTLFPPTHFALFDPATGAVLGEHALPGSFIQFSDCAVAPDLSRVYLAEAFAGSIWIVDLTTSPPTLDPAPLLVRRDTFPSLAVTADGRHLLVTGEEELYSFDTQTKLLVDTVPLAPHDQGARLGFDLAVDGTIVAWAVFPFSNLAHLQTGSISAAGGFGPFTTTDVSEFRDAAVLPTGGRGFCMGDPDDLPAACPDLFAFDPAPLAISGCEDLPDFERPSGSLSVDLSVDEARNRLLVRTTDRLEGFKLTATGVGARTLDVPLPATSSLIPRRFATGAAGTRFYAIDTATSSVAIVAEDGSSLGTLALSAGFVPVSVCVADSRAAVVTLDFETEDDFTTPFVNGQDIQGGEEFGRMTRVDGLSREGLLPAIFDSSPTGPNEFGSDPDLLVDRGNVLILQEQAAQSVPGIYDVPDDDARGGELVFDFLGEEVTPVSIDLIDLCPAGNQDVTVTLVDAEGRTRVYHAPTGWTGDVSVDGPPGFGRLDLTTLAPQPGFQATATGTEDADFDPAAVMSVLVHLAGSGAVDDLRFIPAAPVTSGKLLRSPTSP